MKIRDVMTRRVISVAPDASILDAARLMLQHNVSGLPVVNATGQVVGIISEHDLLRQRKDDDGQEGPHWLELMIEKGDLAATQAARFHDRRVSEAMTVDPVVVAPTSSIREACRLIEERGVKRLPVVQNNKLVGIIARADLVRTFAKASEGFAATPTPDVSISERLRELERQNWQIGAREKKPI